MKRKLLFSAIVFVSMISAACMPYSSVQRDGPVSAAVIPNLGETKVSLVATGDPPPGAAYPESRSVLRAMGYEVVNYGEDLKVEARIRGELVNSPLRGAGRDTVVTLVGVLVGGVTTAAGEAARGGNVNRATVRGGASGSVNVQEITGQPYEVIDFTVEVVISRPDGGFLARDTFKFTVDPFMGSQEGAIEKLDKEIAVSIQRLLRRAI